jgi:hypothetical protein
VTKTDGARATVFQVCDKPGSTGRMEFAAPGGAPVRPRLARSRVRPASGPASGPARRDVTSGSPPARGELACHKRIKARHARIRQAVTASKSRPVSRQHEALTGFLSIGTRVGITVAISSTQKNVLPPGQRYGENRINKEAVKRSLAGTVGDAMVFAGARRGLLIYRQKNG